MGLLFWMIFGFIVLVRLFQALFKDRVSPVLQARVPEINAEHGLSFDAEPEHILWKWDRGDVIFMAFDQQHRKLVLASGKDKTFCRIEDFSWLRGWSHTSETSHSTTTGAPLLPHTTRHHTHHRIELETADLNCPVLFFDVKSDYEASEWIARLNLLING